MTDAAAEFEHKCMQWIVAAPGAAVDWVCVVSEDEDGVRAGWAVAEDRAATAREAPRRCA